VALDRFIGEDGYGREKLDPCRTGLRQIAPSGAGAPILWGDELMYAHQGVDIEAEFVRKRPQLEYQIAKRVRCNETAADLATEMYIKLRRINPVCQTEAEAWTYLFRMAKSAAIDHIRTHSRRETLLGESHDLVVPEESVGVERQLVASDQLRIVEGALAELPEKARTMLMLSRVHGLTHGEIAEQLGVSKSLIEKYIARALLHCRTRMLEVAEREAEREAALDAGASIGAITDASHLNARMRAGRR
jgi:RNA polymerase sigma factor (sigma-70 family)